MTTQSQVAEVRRYFNDDHQQWRRIYDDSNEAGYVFRMRVAMAVDLCRRHARAPGKALDVGCGCGLGTQELARMGHDVLGIDLAPAMIEQARGEAAGAGLDGRCRFECCDFTAMDPPAGSFDLIMALGFIEYFDDPIPVLGRLRTWLSDTGLLVLQTSNRARLAYLLSGHVGPPWRPNSDGLNCRRYTPGEIERIARGCGLEQVDYRGHGFGPIKIAGRFVPGWRASVWIERRLDRIAARPAFHRLGRLGASVIGAFRKLPGGDLP